MVKEELIELLKCKNSHIDDFRTATLSCVTNLNDIEGDLEKADKYVEFINDRELALEKIKDIKNKIKENAEYSELFESEDEDINSLKRKYDKIHNDIKNLQPKMNLLGEQVLTEMRGEFKKIKQKQSFNKAYLDSPYTAGTRFDVKQ